MIKLQLQIINQRVRGPRADRQQHRRSDGWTDGRMVGWTDGQTHGWTVVSVGLSWQTQILFTLH